MRSSVGQEIEENPALASSEEMKLSGPGRMGVA